MKRDRYFAVHVGVIFWICWVTLVVGAVGLYVSGDWLWIVPIVPAGIVGWWIALFQPRRFW